MSTSSTRSSATDSYKILSLYNVTDSQLENDLVKSLVKGSTQTVSEPWSSTDLDPNYVNTSAIFNFPAGTVTKNSAISLEHIDSSSNSTYSINLGNDNSGNTFQFSMLGSSSSFYDSNYVITQSYLTNNYDNVVSVDGTAPLGAKFLAVFDDLNSNNKSQRAVNSRWNTKTGPFTSLSDVGDDTIIVTEDVSLNSLSSFGMEGTTDGNYISKYAVSDLNTGKLSFVNIDSSYQLVNNGLEVIDIVDLSNISYNDIGIFRFQHNLEGSTGIHIITDDGTSIDSTLLQYLPIMDSNAQNGVITKTTSKSDLNVPYSFTTESFSTFFSQSVLDTVVTGYTFNVHIQDGSGGYFVTLVDPIVDNNNKRMITDLNNSNLLDNPYYMANFVGQQHSITFSDASLNIDLSTNAIIQNANSININLTDGETLPSQYAGVNGQIKINPNTDTTRTTDVSFNGMAGTNASNISVFYTGANTINQDMMTNPYLAVNYKKVALRSSAEPAQNIEVSNNGAFLTLYSNNSIVNNIVDASLNFTFNSNLYNDDYIRLWRIESTNILVSQPNSFYSNYDETSNQATNLVNGITVNSVMKNIHGNSLNYDSYRLTLLAKTLTNINLYNAVYSTVNWTINYKQGSYLTTDSVLAFNSTNSLPNFDSNLITSINSGNPLYYKYEYKTSTTSNSHGSLQDYIQVTYSPNQNFINNVTTFTIPQTDITRTYTNVLPAVINSTFEGSYNLITSPYTIEQWRLVQVTASSTFNATFNPKYGPFNNIIVGINNLSQTNIYYALQNRTSGQLAPPSSMQYVTSSYISGLQTVNETITPPNSGTMVITGTFTSNDLKGFMAQVEGRAIDGTTWTPLTSQINFDTYYSLQNTNEFTYEFTPGQLGDIITFCEHTPFNITNPDVYLTNQYYYIPFVYDSNDLNYTLSSFTSSPNEIANKTNLLSNQLDYFSVTNNYSCIDNSSWTNSNYTIDISDFNNDTIVMNVFDNSNNLVFTINRKKNDIYLGTNIITYIQKDIWLSEMNLGASSSNNIYSYNFSSNDYSGGNIINSSIIPGIQVQINSNTYSAGSNVSFRVLGDFVTVNPVGSCLDPTSSNELGLTTHNNGLLGFQYVENTSNYSAIFTFNKYRGYQVTAGVQNYTIKRNKTSVTFNVGNSLSQVLTQNMYYNQLLTVNNLVDSSNSTCANLNIMFNALYSIHPTDAILTYPVDVLGDAVKVSISNLNYSGEATNLIVPNNATPVVDPKSYLRLTNLKTYGRDDIYTFSGIYLDTNNLVALRPSRVKITNFNFPYTTVNYNISSSEAVLNVYKAKINVANKYNFLGNPALMGLNNPAVSPPSTKWDLIETMVTLSQKYNGIRIGRKLIRQNQNNATVHSISYFLSVPPYYKYECVSTYGNLNTPYEYSSLSNNNKVITYLPFNVPNSYVFNPFKNIVTIIDVNDVSNNIIHNSSFINNITFTHLQPRTLIDLALNPYDTQNKIIVPGVKLQIKLYKGLYDSSLNEYLIYNNLSTSIPNVFDISSNKIVFKNRDNNGSINFSVAQIPSMVGYDNGLQGYQEVFRTTDQIYYYNIDFNLGNVLWYNNNSPITYFNSYGNGIRPTLYTVIDINNPITKVNSRRVYKYDCDSNIQFNTNITNQSQAITIAFTQGRKYFDKLVTQGSFSSNPSYIWDYNQLLANTDISGGIVWTTDNSFSETVYLSWAFGNSDTSTEMPINLFYTENEAKKWVYITLLPFQTCLNQFNLPISEISWDGSITTPLLVTRTVNLQPDLQSPPLLISNNNSSQQYSKSSLNN